MESIDSGSVIQVLDAFDAAWQQQPTPPLEPYLPPADHPSRQSILVGLVSIDMERRLKARQAVRTEDYLERFPELRHDVEQLLDLVLLEYRLRQQHGLDTDVDELTQRFPELAEQLSIHLHETVFPLPDGGSGVRSTTGLDLREYDLLEALGHGGMGEVYRCRDPGLGRDLALKVLRPMWQGHAEAESRFEQEARITGSLQHPGVVPVYNLGRLPDGRLYFTMKVVHGRTFAEILHRPGERTAQQQAENIAVFEKVCQTLAYAHSKGVIHRDLKPGNIMVGAFGEVQLIDWGLAKVLPRELMRTEMTRATVPPSSMVLGATGDNPALHSRDGDVLGTYAYMAPEQACGAVDQLDERCDVFGLGAVLCEMLTGQPPYTGPTPPVLRDRAMRGDLAPALARLASCGTDAELVELASRCLEVEPAQRPRNAEEVARAVGAHVAGVQQRLRESEQKRAAAEARAVEAAARVKAERRARRLLLGLAAAVLVVVLVGGAGARLWEQQRAHRTQAEQQASAALERGRGLLAEGWQAHDLAKLKEAKAEAERANDIAQRGGVSTELHTAAGALQTEVQERLARWEKNRKLLSALRDVAIPEKSHVLQADRLSLMAPIAQKSEDDQYADAFRGWGMDVDGWDEKEVVAQLQDEPMPVIEEVVAGLDAWMLARRREESSRREWRRLYRVAQQLDTNVQRRHLRELLGERVQPEAESVAGLLGPALPWPALGELAAGNAWRRLRALSEGIHSATAPVLTVVLLAQTSRDVGDAAEAERLLRRALAVRPEEVVLLFTLGKLLEGEWPGRRGEAIECYRAIRARDRRLGVALGAALGNAGRLREAEEVFRELIHHQPRNPELRYDLGIVLAKQKKLADSVAAFQDAIRLKPDYPAAYYNLGTALVEQNKQAEAVGAFREAIRLEPAFPGAQNNLGIALTRQNKAAEAVAAFQEAIRRNSDDCKAHYNLGHALAKQNKQAEAVAAYKEAIRIQPDLYQAHNNLGNALAALNKQSEAAAAYKEAIRLEPDFPGAYFNLGNALARQNKHAEAEAAYREAIRLKPDDHTAHNNLATMLAEQNKHAKAVNACREAIRLKPDYSEAYNTLGIVLGRQNKDADAEAAFREAIRLKPGDHKAYFHLGIVLVKQNKQAAAAEAFKEAVRLQPDDHQARYNLGTTLMAQNKLAEAETAFKETIRINPDIPQAHCNLGYVLRLQGKFVDSLAAFRRGHELGSQTADWPYPSALWVRQARRLVELNAKLPALLSDDTSPKGTAEGIELAELCSLKRWYARSARFYANAFAANSTLADDLKSGQRYNAACAAALAGCGQGKDADKLDDKQRAFWRRQALDWLNADLKRWSAILEKGNAPTITAVRQQMQHWRTDNDLAGVRDKDALPKLPEDERKQWQKLWADVEDLCQRAARK